MDVNPQPLPEQKPETATETNHPPHNETCLERIAVALEKLYHVFHSDVSKISTEYLAEKLRQCENKGENIMAELSRLDSEIANNSERIDTHGRQLGEHQTRLDKIREWAANKVGPFLKDKSS